MDLPQMSRKVDSPRIKHSVCPQHMQKRKKHVANCPLHSGRRKLGLRIPAAPSSSAQLSESEIGTSLNGSGDSHPGAAESPELRERLDSGSHTSTSTSTVGEVEINLVGAFETQIRYFSFVLPETGFTGDFGEACFAVC